MIYIKEDFGNDINLTSVENILDGYVDNVEDDQINNDIKMWSRFSRILGSGKWYTHMSILVDGERFYDPSFNNADLIETKKGYKLYELDGVKVISEYRNGINFLYFKNDDDANRYIDEVNSRNAEETLESLTEDGTDEPEDIYYATIETYLDDDVDSIVYSVNEVAEDSWDQISEIRQDALERFCSKLEREVEENSVNIKNRLNIDDFDFTISESDPESGNIWFYFSVKTPIDIDVMNKLFTNILSKINVSASDTIEMYGNSSHLDAAYDNGGVPVYDSEDVEYSVIVTFNSINIEKVED